jgi:hypothetical protein
MPCLANPTRFPEKGKKKKKKKKKEKTLPNATACRRYKKAK